MKKLIFERNEPSGSVIINLPELGIIKDLKYTANRTFHKEGIYEQFISKIEKENEDKFLIIVNDNSNHSFVKRCYIQVFSELELKK